MSNRPWQHNGLLAEYEKILRDRIATETDAILSGRCTEHAEYKVRVARRHAYLQALEDLGDALKTYLKEDEDEPGN